jgi:O-6-methylguanine DNA methyltransferase
LSMNMKAENVKTESDVREFLMGWSEFEREVYLATFRIPYGKVSTYGRIARAVGRPHASRAVANALHNNPLYPTVPCWRVVKADGGFGGDPKAAAGRREHVESEGVPTRNGKVPLKEGFLL